MDNRGIKFWAASQSFAKAAGNCPWCGDKVATFSWEHGVCSFCEIFRIAQKPMASDEFISSGMPDKSNHPGIPDHEC